MKVIGKRYWLHNGITAEVYDSGTIILVAGDIQELYDKEGVLHSATDKERPLWVELGKPENIRECVEIHGRPHGMLWRQE